MTTIQFRRRLIVVLLLCVAVSGALIRHFAAPGTTRHDIGTVMMLLWLPVIGQVVHWVFGKLRRRAWGADAAHAGAPAGPPSFDDATPFAPQVLAELTLRPASLPSENFAIASGMHSCALVIGNQGFSARWLVGPGQTLRRGTPHSLPVEFLKPALAAPFFAPGASFRVLVGEAFVGDGRVLRLV